jgi:uncharacterized protein (DUF427 family)
MKVPGPDHTITIAPKSGRVRVVLGGRTIAETERALALQESGYKPVLDIVREDADMSLLVPSDHKTYCPYKGEAEYFSIQVGERVAHNAVWSYPRTYPAVAEIAGRLAFYPDRVDAIEDAGNDR